MLRVLEAGRRVEGMKDHMNDKSVRNQKLEINITRFLSVTLFFMGIILFLNFSLVYRNAKSNLMAMKENEVLRSAAEYGNFYVESEYTVKAVAYSLEGLLTEQASSEEMLRYLQRQSKIYSKLVDDNSTGLYGFIKGEYLDGSGWIPDADYVPQDRPWYQTAKEAKGKIAVVSPYVDSQTGMVMISICKLLSDRKSVVSLDVSLDGTQALVEKTAAQSDWNSVLVVDGDGFIVAHSDKTQVGTDYLEDQKGLGHAIAEKMSATKDRSFEVRSGGKRYEIFVAPIWDDWHAVAAVEAGKCFESLYKLYILFFVSLCMIFGVIISVYLHMRHNRRRESELNRQIKAIAGIYVTVHLIDIRQDTFYEVAVNADYVRAMLNHVEAHAQYSLRMVMDSMTDQRYKKGMYAFINFATLGERLKDRQSISKEFISIENHRCRGVFVPVEWEEDGSLRSVLWLVENIGERGE